MMKHVPLYCASLMTIEGKKHARTLGIRTLNFSLDKSIALKSGIYAGYVLIDTKRYEAAIHFGPRPFLKDSKTSLEAHLLDTVLEHRPNEATIECVRFLRNIHSFPDQAALVKQIERDIVATRRALVSPNWNRVYAFGTFDGIHAGHLSYLRQAKKHGEYLSVIIARDATVERTKGTTPQFPEQERLQLVASTDIADDVILGRTGKPLDIFSREQIDVAVLGYDHRVTESDVVAAARRAGQETRIVRARSLWPGLLQNRFLKSHPLLNRLLRHTR